MTPDQYRQSVLAQSKNAAKNVAFNAGIVFNPQTATTQDYLTYPILETEAVITDDGAKPVMLKRPAIGQVCVIDWLNITFKASTFDNWVTEGISEMARESFIIKEFEELLLKILGFGIQKQNDHGLNFYQRSYRLEHNAGEICIGCQNDTIMLMLSGIGCTYAPNGWEGELYTWLFTIAKDPKITRIDLAHDDLFGDYTDLSWFARQDDKGGFACGGYRKPNIEMRGNWKRPNGKGRSLYIGTRRSSKYCRIYEKGKQLGDPNSPWLRAEVEFKSKSIYIPLHVLVNPSPFFLAAYPCFHIFDPQNQTNQQKFERIEQQHFITFADAVHITRHQFGRYLHCFRTEFAKHNLTDKQLLDLLTDLDNKAYPDRLDPLSIPQDLPNSLGELKNGKN